MNLEIEKWLAYCVRDCTPRTIEFYGACIRAFETYLSNDGEVLSKDAIEAYIDNRLAAKWSKRYVNGNLTAIKSYCRWRSKTAKVKNPAKRVKMLKEDQPNQRVLTQEEFEKVLAVAFGQERDIIVLLANTGLRITEFINLTWEKISPDFQTVSFAGKGNKVRVVPLNRTCRDILNIYAKQGTTGKLPFLRHRTCKCTVNNMCKRLAKQAGIPAFGPHACRHYFATWLMRKNVPLFKISKILGHASIAITEHVYIHWIREDVLGVTDCLDN